MTSRARNRFLLSGLLLVLSGCAGNGRGWNPDDYTVKSGDTVYSIAWRYEVDPEEFAAWNNLGPGKLIKPGQRLHTRPPAGYRAGQGESEEERRVAYAPDDSRPQPVSPQQGKIPPGTPWVTAQKGDTLYSISRRSEVSVKQLAMLNQLDAPYTIQPGQTIFLKPLDRPLSRPLARPQSGSTVASAKAKPADKSAGTSSATASSAYVWPKSIRWQRPAKGKVVKRYNRWKSDAKGIDIAGRMGDPVRAAADGKVVYSGNGLISYGNLVIIKHNKHYLSAYAYNRKLLVKEGQRVKAGQKIAEMGSKEAGKVQLHFEIRKNGKPVDPLKYIPWS